MSIKPLLARGGQSQFLGAPFVRNLLSAQLLVTTDNHPHAARRLLTDDDFYRAELHLGSVPVLIEMLFEGQLTLALVTALCEQEGPSPQNAAVPHMVKALRYLDAMEERYGYTTPKTVLQALLNATQAQIHRIGGNPETACELFDRAAHEFQQAGKHYYAAICKVLAASILLRQGMTQEISGLTTLVSSLEDAAQKLDAPPHDAPTTYGLRPWALAARVWLATAYGQQGKRKAATKNLIRTRQLSESCQLIRGEWPYLAYEDMDPSHEFVGGGLTVYRPVPLLCGLDPSFG